MSDPVKPPISSLLGPSSAVIARTVGIVCIALGFILGMESLQTSGSSWLRTSQALIVTGLIAQGYAMYCTIQRARQRSTSQETQDKDTDSKDKDHKEE